MLNSRYEGPQTNPKEPRVEAPQSTGVGSDRYIKLKQRQKEAECFYYVAYIGDFR